MWWDIQTTKLVDVNLSAPFLLTQNFAKSFWRYRVGGLVRPIPEDRYRIRTQRFMLIFTCLKPQKNSLKTMPKPSHSRYFRTFYLMFLNFRKWLVLFGSIRICSDALELQRYCQARGQGETLFSFGCKPQFSFRVLVPRHKVQLYDLYPFVMILTIGVASATFSWDA